MHIIEEKNLAHYGVLGMRWGQRRSRKQGLRKASGEKYTKKELGRGYLSAMGKSAIQSAALSGLLGSVISGNPRHIAESAAVSAAIGVAITAIGNAPLAYRTYKDADK